MSFIHVFYIFFSFFLLFSYGDLYVIALTHIRIILENIKVCNCRILPTEKAIELKFQVEQLRNKELVNYVFNNLSQVDHINEFLMIFFLYRIRLENTHR